MDLNRHYFENLNEIRSIMEKSSRFISLSGMSGVMAGIYALAGAYAVHWYNHMHTVEYASRYLPDFFSNVSYYRFYLVIAFSVLFLSIITGIFLTMNRAKRRHQTIWDQVAMRMLINLSIPLLAGAGFVVIVLQNNYFNLIAPALLVFYGLGLINGSKYTLNDIRLLGILEVITGLLCGMSSISGLYFMAFGFGVLHIVYGLYMWMKYERNEISFP